MIYSALIVGGFVAVIYSCIAISTSYDKEVSDKEQEAFLRKMRE